MTEKQLAERLSARMSARVREKTGPGEPKYCTNHKMSADPTDGRWMASDNGLYQRWVCKSCFNKFVQQFNMKGFK